MIVHGIVGAIERTWWQLVQLFAVPFALAVALQWIGDRIRRNGVGRFGSAYWYLVAPGVVCHESGHAVGCLITGCRIRRFVPFTRTHGDRLGWVEHEAKRGLWGGVSSFVISIGPVWFGCLMIALLICAFGGVVHVARYDEYFVGGIAPGLVEYLLGLIFAVGGLATSLFADGVWGWGFAAWLYLVFCIASEIGLSGADLRHMWRGAATIAVALFLLNLVPPVGRGVSVGIGAALPWLFKIHVLMLAALALNSALLAVFKITVLVLK